LQKYHRKGGLDGLKDFNLKFKKWNLCKWRFCGITKRHLFFLRLYLQLQEKMGDIGGLETLSFLVSCDSLIANEVHHFWQIRSGCVKRNCKRYLMALSVS
jgi:hypothetical protein